MAKGLWVVLNVDNIEKSLEFYKMLGLKAKRNEQEGMTWGEVSSDSNVGVLLWNKNAIGPNQDQADLRAWLSGEMGKGVMINFGVPNAQRVWDNGASRLTVDQPIFEEPWGGRSFSVVDPDGYVVSLSDKWPQAAKPKKAVKRVVAKAKKVVKGATAKRKSR